MADSKDDGAIWDRLERFTPTARHLDRSRIVSARRQDPVAGAIDQLRTRVLNVLEERNWRHLGITSPTQGCGKTFVATNLGYSFSRQKHLRTMLLDMDLRNPSLARALGISDLKPLGPALQKPELLETRFLRLSENLAVAANGTPEPDAAEVLKSSATAETLARTFERFRPDVVLYDLPPVLVCDDVLSFRDQLDAVIVVARGGLSTRAEIRELEGLLDGNIPILGTVLNEADDSNVARYARY